MLIQMGGSINRGPRPQSTTTPVTRTPQKGPQLFGNLQNVMGTWVEDAWANVHWPAAGVLRSKPGPFEGSAVFTLSRCPEGHISYIVYVYIHILYVSMYVYTLCLYI